MTRPTRARRGGAPDRGDVRSALLAAALELLAESDDASLSLRAVARRVGVSHPAAYHHFTSKESLLAALAAEGFRRLDAAMESASAPLAARPREHFMALGLGYVRFAAANPQLFRVMFRRGAHDPADTALVRAAASLSFRRVLAAVEAASAHRPGGSHDATVLAWTAMHGLAALWLDGPVAAWSGEPSVDPVAERVAHLLGELLFGGAARKR